MYMYLFHPHWLSDDMYVWSVMLLTKLSCCMLIVVKKKYKSAVLCVRFVAVTWNCCLRLLQHLKPCLLTTICKWRWRPSRRSEKRKCKLQKQKMQSRMVGNWKLHFILLYNILYSVHHHPGNWEGFDRKSIWHKILAWLSLFALVCVAAVGLLVVIQWEGTSN